MTSSIKLGRWRRMLSETLLLIYLMADVALANPMRINTVSGQQIRQFSCKGKSYGVKGVCMFALDCIKNNGTHLGTCIDRFYFGSCCDLSNSNYKIKGETSTTVKWTTSTDLTTQSTTVKSVTFKTAPTEESFVSSSTTELATSEEPIGDITTESYNEPFSSTTPGTPDTTPGDNENKVEDASDGVFTLSYADETTTPSYATSTTETPTESPTTTVSETTTTTSTTTTLPPTTTTAETPTTTIAAETPATTTADTFVAANLAEMDYLSACGRQVYKSGPTGRIVNGQKTSFGEWPWQISLRQWKRTTFMHKCGAALLNDNWAITAAHCVDGVPPEDLLLRIGEFDLSSTTEPLSHVERRVQIMTTHPEFNPRTFENDLALLRFYEPIPYRENIIPICLPTTDDSFVNKTGYVTGWGRLYVDGPLPNILQEVQVPVITNSDCEQEYRKAGFLESIPNIFLCAGYDDGGRDSCEGDSGGPLVIKQPNGRWVLAGIISWGIGCAEPHQPGVYTRISHFREWINRILVF